MLKGPKYRLVGPLSIVGKHNTAADFLSRISS